MCRYLIFDGYADTASRLLHQLFEAQKQTPDLEDGDIVESMHLLALAYSDLGREQEALQFQAIVVDIQKRTKGWNNLATLRSMQSLANAYILHDRPEE